jgi:hypothetical protein
MAQVVAKKAEQVTLTIKQYSYDDEDGNSQLKFLIYLFWSSLHPTFVKNNEY